MKTQDIEKIVKNPKLQWAVVIVLLLVVLYLSSTIRVSNLDLLKDQTTGEYIPLALDPFYFLRLSETLVENNGVYPGFDTFRSPHLEVNWHNEILPQSTVLLWKIITIFDQEATIAFAAILNPVVFFVLGLIIFFILSWFLTKNKWIAIIGTFILTVIPPYLYRTLAGFADHESIGMFGFFIALLLFYLGMNYLEKKKTFPITSSLFGLLAGFGTMFAIASWGGIGKFLFMILPLAFLIRWLTKKDKIVWNYILFYMLWISGIIISTFMFEYSVISIIKGNMLVPSGILTFIVLGYSIAETILIKFKLLNNKLKKYKELISFSIVIVFGAFFYQVFIGSLGSFAQALIFKVLNPFGGSRLAQTVAEQKAPYLTELIAQVGKVVFYTFLAGCFIVGLKIASGIKNKKLRPLFVGSFSFFIFGILFSKISTTSILNGDNLVSKTLFFISFLIVAVSSIYIYKKSDWKIDMKWIMIVAWMIPMLLAVRSAIRVFFAIVPFISMMVPLALFEIEQFGRKSKDNMLKMLAYAFVLVITVMLIVSLLAFYQSAKYQAGNQSPSYSSDWQKAMSWVRNNTAEGSIFAHWWDYGYWVQTGGNRPTFSDGGHSQGSFGNHVMGRYVLTTPNPNTAKSFFKTNNISYMLIDPTDIGKYGAYSSIGTGKDEDDRSSWIVTFVSDSSETQETRNGTIRIYQGGTVLDDDLIYTLDGKQLFLPKGKAGIGAITIENKKISFGNQTGYIAEQPEGIYVYNNQQYKLPIRYLYQEGNLRDFGSGINATVYVYANVINQQFDVAGAVMYLSEKTKDSLVAKLYLMDDPEKEYSELELVHSESQYPFPFYYGGFRGPIKIWKIDKDDMNDILIHEEFSLPSAEFGLLDDFEFVKD